MEQYDGECEITLYNYADNIISYTSNEEKQPLAYLESDLSNLMSWFKTNCLSVNGGKLQCIRTGAICLQQKS